MHALDFVRNSAKVPVKPVYALFGDDAFLRHEALGVIARGVFRGSDPGEDELATRRFAGDQAGLADILDEVQTLPFFSKRRLVIVEGADAFVTTHRRELETYLERPS